MVLAAWPGYIVCMDDERDTCVWAALASPLLAGTLPGDGLGRGRFSSTKQLDWRPLSDSTQGWCRPWVQITMSRRKTRVLTPMAGMVGTASAGRQAGRQPIRQNRPPGHAGLAPAAIDSIASFESAMLDSGACSCRLKWLGGWMVLQQHLQCLAVFVSATSVTEPVPLAPIPAFPQRGKGQNQTARPASAKPRWHWCWRLSAASAMRVRPSG